MVNRNETQARNYKQKRGVIIGSVEYQIVRFTAVIG